MENSPNASAIDQSEVLHDPNPDAPASDAAPEFGPLEYASWDIQKSIRGEEIKDIDEIILPFRDSEAPGSVTPKARERLSACTAVAMKQKQFNLAKKLFDLGVHVDHRCIDPAIEHSLAAGITEMLEMLLHYG